MTRYEDGTSEQLRDDNKRLVRAHEDAADFMIACPPNDVPIKRGSGTWATVRMALKAEVQLAIVYPDGHIEEHRWPTAQDKTHLNHRDLAEQDRELEEWATEMTKSRQEDDW